MQAFFVKKSKKIFVKFLIAYVLAHEKCGKVIGAIKRGIFR